MENVPFKSLYESMSGLLDEKAKRLFAATGANLLGYGGVSKVSREIGMSRQTIQIGQRELKLPDVEQGRTERIRRLGAGRKRLTEADPALRKELEELLESTTRGDPESVLLWTSKSVRHLAQALTQLGHPVGKTVVAQLLQEMGYSLQANRKTREGIDHPDRNAQFEHINTRVKAFQSMGCPVISVDTKKKENVGNFKNAGQEYRPKGQPEEVAVHDFPDKLLGKAAPYGIYDLTQNAGWVNVGISHDTATFAVNSIRQWWVSMGCQVYSKANKLLITADAGGSNGYRLRLWKVELQKLATETGLDISVCHLPPGTSKWNKIEHRLFSFITQNWRGKPLVSLQVIVNLIAATTTSKGLKVHCQLDHNIYEKGIKITNEEMEALKIVKDTFHEEWNYTIQAN
jgi:transposase